MIRSLPVASAVLVSFLTGCVTPNPSDPNPPVVKFSLRNNATHKTAVYSPNNKNNAIPLGNNFDDDIIISAYAPGGMKNLSVTLTTYNTWCAGALDETPVADVTIDYSAQDAYFDYASGSVYQNQAYIFRATPDVLRQQCTGDGPGTTLADGIKVSVTANSQNPNINATSGAWYLKGGN